MLESVLYSFFAGVVGTMIGAVIPLFFKIKSDTVTAGLMSFAAGFMLAVVFFDLFPESIARSKLWIAVLAVGGGVLFIMLLNLLTVKPFRKLQLFGGENGNFGKLGIMIVIAIGLHNFPEGMAIGSLEALDKGVLMAVLIGIHNIPEGIAMSAPLCRAGMKKWKILLASFASGVPTILGAMIGFWAGSVSGTVISICLGVAAGAMLYIIFEEMLRDSYTIAGKKGVTLFNLLGIILGVLLINLL